MNPDNFQFHNNTGTLKTFSKEGNALSQSEKPPGPSYRGGVNKF